MLLGLIALAVGVRWAVIGHELDRLDDPDGYLHLARSLAQGDGFTINGHPTAYRPPLYPILLTLIVAVGSASSWSIGIAWLHLSLGALTVASTADAARRWGLGRPLVWVAALITAFDPVLVVQARALMTETLAAALVAFTLWGVSLPGRVGPLVGGLGFGLATLCRPSLLPAAAIGALLGCLSGPDRWRTRCERSVVVLGITAVVLVPWGVRNKRMLGEAIVTTTHGGYTLALANNPAYYGDVLHGPPGAVWSGPHQVAWIDAINAATAGLSEPESDRFLRRRAVDFARAHPQDFVRATAARLGRFWGVMPAAAVYPAPLRWATAGWTVPCWVLVAVGLSQPRVWRWPGVVALAFILSLTLIHAIYWTDLRMRAPLVPTLALVATTGWERLAGGSVRRQAGSAVSVPARE